MRVSFLPRVRIAGMKKGARVSPAPFAAIMPKLAQIVSPVNKFYLKKQFLPVFSRRHDGHPPISSKYTSAGRLRRPWTIRRIAGSPPAASILAKNMT